MTWPYSGAVVHELVKAPKCLAPGHAPVFSDQGEHGKELSALLELVDGGLYHLRLVVTAGRADTPATYDAALLLNNRRVRGIGFSKLARKKRFKTHIPKGWHENILDYLLPISDAGNNRHDPLPEFFVTDLQDFLKKVCLRWNIHIDFAKDLW